MGGTRHGRRVTMVEAAEILGVSVEAIRKRVQRDTIRSDKGEDGRRYVYLDESRPRSEEEGSSPLVEELRDRVRSLEEQLREERRANDENRRLLAAALERIPAIEAPSEPLGEPETGAEMPMGPTPPEAHEYAVTEQPGQAEPTLSEASEEAQEPAQPRSWWRRMFGG